MLIDMNPILSGASDILKIDYTTSLTEPIYGVSFPEPIKVNGSIKDSGGYISLDLTAVVHYETECARCLRPITGDITIAFSRGIADDNSLQNEDNDDYIIIRDGMLDIDTPLCEQLYIEFPTRFLCRDDCRGLCPKCGRDLNESECGCEMSEPDPRFLELLKRFEETDEKENK